MIRHRSPLVPDVSAARFPYMHFWAVMLVLLNLGVLWGTSLYAQNEASATMPQIEQTTRPADQRLRAGIITLHGEVNDVMLASLERQTVKAKETGCTILILDIDTYGGLVTSALEISKFIKKQTLPTVAWVHDKAYSAGAIISLACQRIVIAPTGSIGDAAPIASDGMQAQELTPDLKAKATSPIIQELNDSAKRNGFNPLFAHAMVITNVEVYKIRNTVTGEVKYVDGKEKLKFEVAATQPADTKTSENWVVEEPPIDVSDTLLTLSPEQAVEFGLADHIVATQQELITTLNLQPQVMVFEYTWSERLSAWFAQMYVRMILFVAMMILIYIESLHPGTSIAGIGAGICLVLMVGAPYISGLAELWEILLIVAGLAIIIVDLIYGGMGLLAIPGFIMMAVGLVFSFVPSGGGGLGWLPAMWTGLFNGLIVLIFGSVISLIVFFFMSRYLSMTPGFKHLRLEPATVSNTTTIADATDRSANDAVYVDAAGHAMTDLRPAGKAQFGGHLVDVVTDGDFVPVGTRVRIITVTNLHVVVRPQIQQGEA